MWPTFRIFVGVSSPWQRILELLSVSISPKFSPMFHPRRNRRNAAEWAIRTWKHRAKGTSAYQNSPRSYHLQRHQRQAILRERECCLEKAYDGYRHDIRRNRPVEQANISGRITDRTWNGYLIPQTRSRGLTHPTRRSWRFWESRRAWTAVQNHCRWPTGQRLATISVVE